MNRVIFQSRAHAICRKWKKAGGFRNAEVVALLKSSTGEGVHKSNITMWMGESKQSARLIPEDHAYALYMERYWSQMYGNQRQVSDHNLAEEMKELVRDLRDKEQGKGRLLRFPFWGYQYSRLATRSVVKAYEQNKDISKDDLLAILKQSEAASIEAEQQSFTALREILTKAQESSGDPEFPEDLVFTKKRKAFLYYLFSLWVLEDRTAFEEWEHVMDPGIIRELLISQLK
jgi:hypothetical protein